MKSNTLENDIKILEKNLVTKKEWKYNGEIKASARPVNSLVKADVEFETNVINIPITKEENSSIFKHIAQRFKEKTFDNYDFATPEGKVEEETYDLEFVENNKEIFELYDKIERSIKNMADYGSN